MTQQEQKEFIQFLKVSKAYKRFKKNYDGNFCCYTHNITLRKYLNIVNSELALHYAFSWHRVPEGSVFWATRNKLWEQVRTK